MAEANAVATPGAENPFSGFQQRFKALPQKNKMGILFGIPLVIGVIVAMMMWANQASYRVLFSGLSDQDGGAIVQALTQLNIPYQHNSTGTAIMVPSNQVYDARLALASQGLPKGSVVGFEVMDDQQLGITQFQEQVNYQRALEGELTRSIQSLSAVRSARVHLAIPKPSIFIRDRQLPSASVVLTLFGGRFLTDQQVSGIVNLVSSSLPGLMPEKVNIVDQSGRLLTQGTENDSGLNPTQLAFTQQIENNLTQRIVDILTPVFGRENIRATVTADVNFAETERTDELYKPNTNEDKASLRSKQISEQREGGINAVEGVPGVLANTPPGQVEAPINENAQANINNQQNNNPEDQLKTLNRDSIINYEVDKTIQYTKEQIGKIQRLSTAVVINFKTLTDPRGETRQVPLTPEEKIEIDNLIRQAIGFNEERGDQINVLNQAFVEPEVYLPSFWENPETMDILKSLGMPLGVALLAAIFVFGLIKPLFKPLQDSFDGPNLLPQNNQNLLEGPSEESRQLLEKIHEEVDMPDLSKNEKLDRLRAIAREHPQIVAAIIRNWVGSERK